MFKLRATLPRTRIEETRDKYDVVIVGGGPAGLSAALYTARYGLKPIVITKTIGGNAAIAPLVDDYLGIPEIPGQDLVDKFVKHVEKYNVPIIIDEVVDLFKDPENQQLWCVKTKSRSKPICGYAVILAMGSEKRKLGVPGEDRLLGRGVSYCAVCDGAFFKDKVVAVVGGGNSAFISALYLSNLASKVYLIHRRESFRAFETYIEAARKNPKIEILTNTIVKEILGEEKVEGLKLVNTQTNEEKILIVDAVFIEIGTNPPTEFFKKVGIEVDEEGKAKVNIDMSTNLPGVYAAGDAAGGPYKYKFEQIVTAVAEGAIAADAVAKYIATLKKTS